MLNVNEQLERKWWSGADPFNPQLKHEQLALKYGESIAVSDVDVHAYTWNNTSRIITHLNVPYWPRFGEKSGNDRG